MVSAISERAQQLTSRQRNTAVILRAIANDMGVNGTASERVTAALLQLVVVVIERGEESDLLKALRAFRLERDEGEP